MLRPAKCSKPLSGPSQALQAFGAILEATKRRTSSASPASVILAGMRSPKKE